MRNFKLSKQLLKELNKLVRSFWWGQKAQEHKINWVPWSQMSKSKTLGGLGLRDFKNFNCALLAKQGWRVITTPNSLAAKVLKKKYFKHSSFPSAKSGHNSSFLWQSFTSARPLLKEGLIWLVGDGESVEIWNDKWFPQKTSYQPQSTIRFLSSDSKVAMLFDKTSHQWNLPLVEAIFNRAEADILKRIPLSPYPTPDRMIWRCTTTGSFTVNSAYHLRIEMENLRKRQSSNGPSEEKVTKEDVCPICKLQPETIEHALWECPSAQDVWSQCGKKLQKTNLFFKSFRALLESLLESHEEEYMLEFALTVWLIWKRRNDLVFNNQFPHPSSITQAIKSLTADLHQSQQPAQAASTHSNAKAQWEAPLQGKLKLNWDAGIDKLNYKVGVGAVIRDWKGKVRATLRMSHSLFPEPLLTEAFAAYQASMFLKTLGWQDVIIEGDSLQVVKGLMSPSETDSYTGLLIRDTKITLNSFTNWSARHTRRACNNLAHVLCKDALSISNSIVTVGVIPSCIQSLV
ncbi:hypothetical protein CIPAW_11G073400 [Carya illinoinensis]|uniref:RNase H type-1 domain-containing protein n=1 Tax=Carya illinoinensis TaxID=32201 RepID=A0A8T1P284_CARIL|nr:hypothetical protein CIPAW_11G073400 [Carya illinoinensis]